MARAPARRSAEAFALQPLADSRQPPAAGRHVAGLRRGGADGLRPGVARGGDAGCRCRTDRARGAVAPVPASEAARREGRDVPAVRAADARQWPAGRGGFAARAARDQPAPADQGRIGPGSQGSARGGEPRRLTAGPGHGDPQRQRDRGSDRHDRGCARDRRRNGPELHQRHRDARQLPVRARAAERRRPQPRIRPGGDGAAARAAPIVHAGELPGSRVRGRGRRRSLDLGVPSVRPAGDRYAGLAGGHHPRRRGRRSTRRGSPRTTPSSPSSAT